MTEEDSCDGKKCTCNEAVKLATDRKLDFYKLEYERAATRYNDIHTSIWNIFNYTLVVAGVAGFLKNDLDTAIRLAIVLLPIMFWYFVIFLPMNRYAEHVRSRLARIEFEISKLVFEGPNTLSETKSAAKPWFNVMIENLLTRFPNFFGVVFCSDTPNERESLTDPEPGIWHFRRFGRTENILFRRVKFRLTMAVLILLVMTGLFGVAQFIGPAEANHKTDKELKITVNGAEITYGAK